LNGENIKAIQHLVASSVPKLDPKSVTVTDSTGRLLSRTTSTVELGGLNDEQLGMQKSLEDYLANKAQSMLDQTIGRGNAVVRVTALLDLNRVERHSERRDPASVVTLNETIRKDSTETFNATTGGAVGVKPIPGDASGVTTPNKNTSKNSSSTLNYGFDLLKEHGIAPVGSIKRLSVAVMIAPKGKLPDAPADAPVTARSKKELDDLTASIREAVGFSPDRNDSIKITEVAFEVPALAASTASSSSSALDLVKGHVSDILAFAGVLLMAFIFWRMFSKLTVPVPVVATAKKELIRTLNNAPEARQVTVALSEEVKQLVTENNTQAVNLIRSMIR
jgi:flagellar M-ring protein FliF